MTKIVLQQWSNSNMAGDEWRWEVYAVSNGNLWSIRARQVDEITGRVYRVAGTYRLKSAWGIRTAIERIFCNDSIAYEEVEIDWGAIVFSLRPQNPAMADALEIELDREERREQMLSNPKETAESRRSALINHWIRRADWCRSRESVVQKHRRMRALFQYIDTYFKEQGCFPEGQHDVDVVLESSESSAHNSCAQTRAIRSAGRVELSVVFPTEA